MILAVCAAPMLVAGCRTNPKASREIALLRAEILDLEDQYYSLKHQYRQAVQDLREVGGEAADKYPLTDEPYCDSPIIYDDGTILQSTPTVAPQGQPIDLSPQQPGQIDGSDGSYLQIEEGQIELQGSQITRASMRHSDNRVSAISINPTTTRGHDVDGIEGDEGLVVLIQPQTSMGAVVQTSGDLTVSVIDPAEQGDAQRIGIWRFSAEEVSSFFVKDQYVQQGILLHLPWDYQIPRNRQLKLFARFTDQQNQTFETMSELVISPPTADYSPDQPLVAEWLENDERWMELDKVTGNGTPAKFAGFQGERSSADDRAAAPQWRPAR